MRGVIAASLLALNTLFWCALLFLFALVKLVVPAKSVRAAVDRVLNGIATRWVAGNSAWMRLTQRTHWDVDGLADLPYRGWYMVNCNHQSWVDILVLQHLLNRRIPMLKFFLKQQLIYVPVIGLAWWALDFPFMRRHSDAELKRHPEKRFDDIEATRRACEKFALVPTSVMNFAEGTRFTPRQAPGAAFAVSPPAASRRPARWRWRWARWATSSTRCSTSRSSIRTARRRSGSFSAATCATSSCARGRCPFPLELRGGDYARDPKYRKAFQHWLQALWQEKDATIDALLGATPGRADRTRIADGTMDLRSSR